MAGIKDLTNVWNNVKEIDLRPLTEQAVRGVRIAIVGKPGLGRHALADNMRRDPQRPGAATSSSIRIASLEEGAEASRVDWSF